jgi:hypothetical protein
MRAAEGVVSEIHAENEFLQTLGAQKRLAKDNLEQLRGILHPIRCCHSDVLQYIFEWAVEDYEGRISFARATALSLLRRRNSNIF